jgi:hypothetical protein
MRTARSSPNYTDDKLRDGAESAGGKTIVRVQWRDREHIWEPFSTRGEGRFRISRNLLKSVWGNSVIFEEENRDLGLVFRTRWCNSRKFGWIRRSCLENTGAAALALEFLDGIQNIMPSGIGNEFQLRFSTLLDAYKRNELAGGSRLALFRLSAVPSDRPEPAEALSATAAWSIAPGKTGILLCSRQLDDFRNGALLRPETDICGQRGSYFVHGQQTLRPRQKAEWQRRRLARIRVAYGIGAALHQHALQCDARGCFPRRRKHRPSRPRPPRARGRARLGFPLEKAGRQTSRAPHLRRFGPCGAERAGEFGNGGGKFAYFGPDGKKKSIDLPARSLAFTVCQTPFVFRLADREGVSVHRTDGSVTRSDGLIVGGQTAREVLGRTGKIRKVVVDLSARRLVR